MKLFWSRNVARLGYEWNEESLLPTYEMGKKELSKAIQAITSQVHQNDAAHATLLLSVSEYLRVIDDYRSYLAQANNI